MNSHIKPLIFSMSFLTFLVFVDLCVALPSETILNRQDVACQNSLTVAQNPTCWAALGYNTWFDTWKGPCPGSPGCTCDVRKPWSDCVLKQYQTALENTAKSHSSCVDLTMPDICHVPTGDWTKLSENQLATAYASTAIKNLYDFIRGWYIAITQDPAPPVVLEILFDQITDTSNARINKTDVHIVEYLATLMTNHSTNHAFLQSFKNVMTQVIGENTTVNVGALDIHAVQGVLGQALGKILNATISAWNTPFFDPLSKNGDLLDGPQLDKVPQLNDSLTQVPPSQSFDITGASTNPALNNTGRNLLVQDLNKHKNYTIIECGSAESGGMVSHITNLLDDMHNNLFTVMHETANGRRSLYGFTKLWHTNRWIPIRDIYKKIYDNQPIQGSLPTYQTISNNHPVFICLQPQNAATWAAYSICQKEPRLRAFQQPGTPNLIGLCPAFWALPASPPRAFCPYRGRITAGYIGSALQLNQQSILIHQLVRIYLGMNILEEEVFGLREAMILGADEAYRNPSTWAYWYSSVVGCSPLSWYEEPEL